jgi:hypothetical protein
MRVDDAAHEVQAINTNAKPATFIASGVGAFARLIG